MTKPTSFKRWETRPLQCWDKAKEIRRNYEQARVKAAARTSADPEVNIDVSNTDSSWTGS